MVMDDLKKDGSERPKSDTSPTPEEGTPKLLEETTKESYSKYQWTLLLILCVINTCTSMAYSIQAPFYPKEAESKNCTATEYGLVFGSYELTGCIACPLIGTCMHRIGAKPAYHFGLIVTAISIILFGLLTFVESHDAFLAGSFILRIVEAVGASIVFIATTTIVTRNFQKSVGTVFATLQMTFGLGFSMGPTVGSVFYKLGGFPIPFVVLGCTLLLLSIVAFLLLCATPRNDNNANGSQHNNKTGCSPGPGITNTDADGNSNRNKTSSFFDLLKIHSIILYSLTSFSAALAAGFLAATLEPHIRQYNLGPVLTGVMFLLYGGVYACSAPWIGRICDRMKEPAYLTIIGSILIFISFLLIGPAPFVPVKSLLPITIVGLVIFGLGQAFVYVSSFLLTLQKAKKNGFPDNATTSGVVSALWVSCLAFGCFVGPSVAGILMDHFGFRWATSFILGFESVVITLLLWKGLEK